MIKKLSFLDTKNKKQKFVHANDAAICNIFNIIIIFLRMFGALFLVFVEGTQFCFFDSCKHRLEKKRKYTVITRKQWSRKTTL